MRSIRMVIWSNMADPTFFDFKDSILLANSNTNRNFALGSGPIFNKEGSISIHTVAEKNKAIIVFLSISKGLSRLELKLSVFLSNKLVTPSERENPEMRMTTSLKLIAAWGC